MTGFMNHKVLFVLTLFLLTACGREMELSFRKAVGDHHLAEEQVGKAVDALGDYVYSMNWSEDKLKVKFPSKNGISKDEIEVLATQVRSRLMPSDVLRPVLDIEITETDNEVLEFLDLDEGEKFSIPLIWETASAGVYYTEQVDKRGDNLNERTFRNFMCLISVRAEEPLPKLYYGLSFFGTSIPMTVEHTKSISQLEPKFFDQTRMQVDGRFDGRNVDFIVGSMGNMHFVSHSDKSVERSLGRTNKPDEATQSNCFDMIASKVEGDFNGLLPNRAAMYNVSRINVK